MQQPVIVAARRAVAQDVCSFELVGANTDLQPFTAGAHIDVFLPSGLVRQYSLCNDPADRTRYVIGVLNDPNGRGGSAEMHGIPEGARLLVGEPRNCFPLADRAAPAVLFAGGIGVTPLLAMAHDLARDGALFHMYFAARARAKAAFHDDICSSDFADRVSFLFDDQGNRLDAAAVMRESPPGTHFYACGPKGFIAMIEAAANSCGRQAFFHSELFSQAAPSSNDAPFDLVLAKAGITVTVAPDETALSALRRVGITIPTVCEQGVCGTCLTKVLEGAPDHRDLCLSDDERSANDCFAPCCSRALSPSLVVDL